VVMASGKNLMGMEDSIIIDREISSKVQFFLSTTPFCWGVST
jgi:hypothetical protein